MITPLGAAQAIKYLNAAGAMNAVDDQEAVWADYLNSSEGKCANATDADLLPAARKCVSDWNRNESDYRRKVNVDDFAQRVRAAHIHRLDEICGFVLREGLPAPVFCTSDDGGFVSSGVWREACHDVAATDKTLDRPGIFKAATEKIMETWRVQLDPSAEQPDWVRQSFQIEAAA